MLSQLIAIPITIALGIFGIQSSSWLISSGRGMMYIYWFDSNEDGSYENEEEGKGKSMDVDQTFAAWAWSKVL